MDTKKHAQEQEVQAKKLSDQAEEKRRIEDAKRKRQDEALLEAQGKAVILHISGDRVVLAPGEYEVEVSGSTAKVRAIEPPIPAPKPEPGAKAPELKRAEPKMPEQKTADTSGARPAPGQMKPVPPPARPGESPEARDAREAREAREAQQAREARETKPRRAP